jgi:hypothetical protein
MNDWLARVRSGDPLMSADLWAAEGARRGKWGTHFLRGKGARARGETAETPSATIVEPRCFYSILEADRGSLPDTLEVPEMEGNTGSSSPALHASPCSIALSWFPCWSLSRGVVPYPGGSAYVSPFLPSSLVVWSSPSSFVIAC